MGRFDEAMEQGYSQTLRLDPGNEYATLCFEQARNKSVRDRLEQVCRESAQRHAARRAAARGSSSDMDAVSSAQAGAAGAVGEASTASAAQSAASVTDAGATARQPGP